MASGFQLVDFQVHGDASGSLVALEERREVPFKVKRVYYVYGTSRDAVRGGHAHRSLEQLIFCPIGSCDFILDNGDERHKVTLAQPDRGLYLKNAIWREFTNFSPDCVVMVLASQLYDEEDYIRDYNTFLREKGLSANQHPFSKDNLPG